MALGFVTCLTCFLLWVVARQGEARLPRGTGLTDISSFAFNFSDTSRAGLMDFSNFTVPHCEDEFLRSIDAQTLL